MEDNVIVNRELHPNILSNLYQEQRIAIDTFAKTCMKKARRDERKKIKKAIEEEFDDPQHFCSCPEWCNCWKDFWKKR